MSVYFDCADPDERARGLDAARSAIRRGDVVVLPTDTVYGVGADAFTPDAVDLLFRVKGRGRNMPSPVLIGSAGTLDGLANDVPPAVRDLAEAFWPGALTIIVTHAPSLAWDLGETRGTVAVRMPDHPVALSLLTATGPMAVSSANRSGRDPAVTVNEARDQLGDRVAVYLDGGRRANRVASTIIDATGPELVVRRVGALTVDRLREVVPGIVSDAA